MKQNEEKSEFDKVMREVGAIKSQHHATGVSDPGYPLQCGPPPTAVNQRCSFQASQTSYRAPEFNKALLAPGLGGYRVGSLPDVNTHVRTS